MISGLGGEAIYSLPIAYISYEAPQNQHLTSYT